MIRTLPLALLAVLSAGSALAQGSAPAQGVTAPQTPPNPAAAPPAPTPAQLTDGTPRTEAGNAPSPTRTDPGTTAGIPLPSTANTPGRDQERHHPEGTAGRFGS